MNIKFITGSDINPETLIKSAQVRTLALCGQGKPEGQAEGLMPLKLNSAVTVTPRVTVYTNTSTNKRGAVSAVIKVSYPYTALRMTEDGQSVAGADANRSGGELSMHVVLALPAACAADLRGVNGTDSQKGAEGQIAVLARLLTALMGPRLCDAGYVTMQGESEMSSWAASSARRTVKEDGRDVIEPHTSLIPTDDITGFPGYVGFDVSDYTFTKTLDEPLMRMVQKMPPVGCAGVVSNATCVEDV